MVLRVCSVAGPDQEIRAGSRKPQNSGSHKWTACRSWQNQPWGMTLCTVWCINFRIAWVIPNAYSVVVVHADVARVHEEGDGLFKGVLQRSRPPAHILNENYHRVPQRSLVSHSILAFHSVPTSIWKRPHFWPLNCNISGSQPASPTTASPWICRNLGSAFTLSRSSLERWIFQPKSWLQYPWAC